MKTLKTLLPVLLMTLALPCAAASLTPYTATYEVSTHNIDAGVAKFTLKKVGANRWRFKSRSHTTGFVSLFFDYSIRQTSYFAFTDDGQFKALRFDYLESGDETHRQTIKFDWSHNTALTLYHDKKTRRTVPVGTTDPFLAQLKLSYRMAHGMKDGIFPVLSRNELHLYHLQVTNTSRITVPAGRFAVTRVERSAPDSSRTTVFWLMPKRNYIPAKIVQLHDGDTVFRMALKSLDIKRNAD